MDFASLVFDGQADNAVLDLMQYIVDLIIAHITENDAEFFAAESENKIVSPFEVLFKGTGNLC